ncbi:peptidase C39 family protein [uncultured Methanoregula sp.]|uniref:peptidase C39 family protein n=1 Tax=uncultured Methanoregula sp. TaxID=1005933 RepID=UPI002AAADBB2|nr:peptidase C39 family protein [uncultured Methanoregula sp.]
MHAEPGSPIHLKIPFYRQHYDFTCGPASLMMAMKYLDENLRLGKGMEIDVWREATLGVVCGTSRYGLAYSAVTRGFSARVTSNTGGIDFARWCLSRLNDPEMQMLTDLFYERRARCRNLGVRERQERITGETISKSLFLNHVPLIITNSLFRSREDLPHWVTVTGIDDRWMYFNDPFDTRPKQSKAGLPALQGFIGYHGDQSMVEVWKE